MKQKMVKEEQS